MSQRITIQIKDKIATCLTDLPVVCGNSDYVVDFQFDEEWNAHDMKTARFKVNGEYTDVVFSGNVCEMPIIFNAMTIWVGVFAGELSTTTPAMVRCKASILDGDDVPSSPQKEGYNKLIEVIEDMENTIGDIDTALGELHAYAQALVNGGASV